MIRFMIAGYSLIVLIHELVLILTNITYCN